MRGAASAALEGSGFASRTELAEWLELCSWLDAPEADPAVFVWLPDGTGWVPAAAVELRGRVRRIAALPPSGAPRLLTLAEAGALVRVAPETIRYWIWEGRLQGYRPGRSVLVREDELLALVESRETRKVRALNTRRVDIRRVDPKRLDG